MTQPVRSGTSKVSEWVQRRERGNIFWMRVMCWISFRLGRTVSRIILRGIALYFVAASADARHASRDFLRRVFGRPAKLSEVFQHFFTFSTTIHDRLYLLNNRPDVFDIRVFGSDEFMKAQEDNGGLFLFGAHLGSFEAIRATARFNTTLRVCMVMFEENARKLNGFLAAVNPEAAPEIIPLGRLDAMLTVRDRLENGAIVGILADRAPNLERFETVNVLGAPARLPTGPFRMAAMLKQPVFFMCGLHRGGNRYDVHFEPLVDFSTVTPENRAVAIREALEQYAATIERHCRAAPYNWFNFYDFWNTKQNANS